MASASDPREGSVSVVREHMEAEVARALGQGALYAAGLGLFAAACLTILVLVEEQPLYELPALFGLVGGVDGLLVSYLARRGLMRGVVGAAVMLLFTTMPTVLFLVAELRYPAGAASFITGPFSLLYTFLIVLTGFLFRFRVSLAAGFFVALQYLCVFSLARPSLVVVDAKDALLYADLTLWSVALNRCLMYVAVGAATGGIALLAQRLALKVLAEQRSKDAVSRLFGQYVSDEVKDHILASPENHRGKRADVVVLFSDLRGFSTFSEGKEPEEVVERLNAYFDRMVRAVREEGGIVDKLIGDAVMAVFGGLVPYDDAPARAVRAARKMREELRALNAAWADEGLAPFDNGVGLHVGPVVLGPIGSEDRKDFTVIGDAVNTAARLEGLTKELGASLVVTKALYERLDEDERAPFRPLGETRVKGKQETLAIYGADL